MPTHILGISALFHDSAAALLRDGEVVAAAQEERFTRLKHDASFPVRSAEWCLARAGIRAGDLDWLVFYEKPLVKFQRILVNSIATFPRGWRTFPRSMQTWLGEKLWARNRLAVTFGVPPDRILFCEHHLSHAASAFLSSPFDDAAILTVDGVGEQASTTLWRGRGVGIDPVAEVRFPHSLGLFYSAITAYLGFAVNEGEYKVMGMAAYGQPRFREQMDKLLRRDGKGGFDCDLDAFCWHWHATESYTSKLVDLLGPPRFPGADFDPADPECRRHADVAASAQAALEDAMMDLVRHAHATVGSENLCLAGGVALNSVANTRIAREGPFRHLWVQPAAGDAGGALGSAQWAWHTLLGNPRAPELTRLDLGRGWERGEVRKMLDELGAKAVELPEDDVVARAAEDLAAGKVLGWFDGRDEWGPRALGHRSILADPRGPEVQARVNARVKFRELFRPFAPSVTEEAAPAWFDVPAAAAAPARAMLVTPPALQPDVVPAVVHADGSARAQVVRAGDHPRYHALLRTFGEATGVPVLLNTSFNLKGDPMVGTPVDALAAFQRSDLDALYIEGFRVERAR
ncbi:MAG: carbamoyltransferase [Myxococcota bacterium]